MKRVIFLVLVVLTAVGAIFGLPSTEEQEREDDKAAWKRVEAATQKGRPKTAIKELEPIIQNALRDKRFAEAAKAITTKIALEGNVQGNKPETRERFGIGVTLYR